ncbi:threonine dehydratase [Nonomuraea solani]|uniref:threonine ammonia-lyase n=1 Tax=Nonomuraea solani TaxID=1144553 RepID=A0A1H6DJQ8_9ACTN|nr:serine/threonine dehydratase [Nonomuraea solani]SEG85419.1 threonine dehydratase [Nonomuraea solani]
MTTYADVLAAAGRIHGHVLRTPVLEISPGLFFKLELLQHSGSFKVRGAFNRILSAGQVPDSGVIAASGGNHGLAVAFAARALGVRAEIFVPEVTSPVKVSGLAALGAHVTQTGAIYAEAAEAAAKRAAESGALSVHAYDQPEVIAGQGTTGLELMEQTGGVDTVVVAVGGGGFGAGITVGTSGGASSGGPRIVAVEPERIPTLRRALEAGRPVPVEVSGVGADALGATRIGGLAFEILSGPRVESVLVSDEAIMEARHTLWERHRVAAEPAGSAAYAALLSGVYTPAPGERVAVVVCGSNTDPATL